MRWSRGPVVYIGLNVQGSNDNYPHAGVDGETRGPDEIARQRAEHDARETANIHWLDESFAYAKSVGARGVMVIWQADPNFNNEYKYPSTDYYDGFDQIVPALRADTIAFKGQSRSSTATRTTSSWISRSSHRAARCSPTSRASRPSAPRTTTGSAPRSIRATRTCSSSNRAWSRRTSAELHPGGQWRRPWGGAANGAHETDAEGRTAWPRPFHAAIRSPASRR